MKWSKEDDNKSVEMIMDGKIYKDVSIELKRTERSIRERLRKLGYKSSMYNKIEKVCKNCGEIFVVFRTNKQQMKCIFCSSSCSATFNNKKRGTTYY